MTPTEFAEMLNGSQYGNELTRDQAMIAEANDLVVVFGYSDDNMEFEGALREEVGCYNGGAAYVTASGVYSQREDAPADAEEIRAIWCGPSGASWEFETEIPHAAFNVYEDDELFCVGIVFSVEDLA